MEVEAVWRAAIVDGGEAALRALAARGFPRPSTLEGIWRHAWSHLERGPSLALLHAMRDAKLPPPALGHWRAVLWAAEVANLAGRGCARLERLEVVLRVRRVAAARVVVLAFKERLYEPGGSFCRRAAARWATLT